jgi:hypothetical protein
MGSLTSRHIFEQQPPSTNNKQTHMDNALFNKSNLAAIKEFADNSEVQRLIADALRAREKLIDKVVELSHKKGVHLKKVPAHTAVESIGAANNLPKAGWNMDLEAWLTSHKLSWSHLATA